MSGSAQQLDQVRDALTATLPSWQSLAEGRLGHFFFLALASLNLACRILVPAFPQRS